MNLSVGSAAKGFKPSQQTISTETDLLCLRIGLYTINHALTLCAHNRANLGIDFRQGKLCSHPSHSGKGKIFRGLSVHQSRWLL